MATKRKGPVVRKVLLLVALVSIVLQMLTLKGHTDTSGDSAKGFSEAKAKGAVLLLPQEQQRHQQQRRQQQQRRREQQEQQQQDVHVSDENIWATCRGATKVRLYSAAWLVSTKLLKQIPKSHLLENRLFNKGTRMEAGGGILMFEAPTMDYNITLSEKQSTQRKKWYPPRVFKSFDLLQFYVEHLSFYERRLMEASSQSSQQKKNILNYGREGFERALSRQNEQVWAAIHQRNQQSQSRSNIDSQQQQRQERFILAVMPFYAAGQGQGPSGMGLRGPYLNATLASISNYDTNICTMVAVSNLIDLITVSRFEGVCDVLYLPVRSSEKLGAAIVISLHNLLLENPALSWRNFTSTSELGFSGSLLHYHYSHQYNNQTITNGENTKSGSSGSSTAMKHHPQVMEAANRIIQARKQYTYHQQQDETLGSSSLPQPPLQIFAKATHVYYTESDQILRGDLWEALRLVDTSPFKNLVLPHRGVPLPTLHDFNYNDETEMEPQLLNWHKALMNTTELKQYNNWTTVRFLQENETVDSHNNNNNDPHDSFSSPTTDVPMKNDGLRHNYYSCRFPSAIDACAAVPTVNTTTMMMAKFNTELSSGSGGTFRHPLLRRNSNSFAILPAEGNFRKMLYCPCQVLSSRSFS